MDNSTLATGTSTGTQTTTQDPQVSSQSSSLANPSGSVQSSVASSVLNSTTGGIKLNNNPVPTTSLNAATLSTSTGQDSTTGSHHGINPVLLSFSVILFAIAIALFVITTRSAKNTTKNY